MKRIGFLICLFIAILEKSFAKVNSHLRDNLPGTDIQDIAQVTLLRNGPKGSGLFQINSKQSNYDYAPYLLNLGPGLSSYDQGYDNAFLLADAYLENYDFLMVSMLGDAWYEPLIQELLNKFLDFQWVNYLSKQVPQEYLDEIQGISDGGFAAGKKRDLGKIAAWGIVLANVPSSLENLQFIIQDEMENPPTTASEGTTSGSSSMQAKPLTSSEQKQLFELFSKANWQGFTCSMFGVWGSRTKDGRLYTARNLDWLKDSGVAKYKLITIHRPPHGFAHATMGFAGLIGALTGISSQGLTVHEANLESNDITFRGFPWILRVRHVMAYASNLSEALNLWTNTNNTVGYNHGFGSSQDGQAVLLETMEGNNGIFYANDPREQNLMVNGQQIGLAKDEAIFRTNHGYDPYSVEHYMWNDTHAYQNSILRYTAMAELFDNYQQSKTLITYKEAVSITATVGEKGDDHLYDCNFDYDDASNVLSVTFDPKELIAYTAWETGSGEGNWSPAACNTYLAVDLKQFF